MNQITVYLATFAVYYYRIEADQITVSLDYELFGLNDDKRNALIQQQEFWFYDSDPDLEAAFQI